MAGFSFHDVGFTQAKKQYERSRL